MSMKARVAIIITVVVLLSYVTVCAVSAGMQGVSPYYVSWAEFYASINDLSTEADLIAVGTVKDIVGVTSDVIGNPRWGPDILYFTDFAFSVEQVLKGPQDVGKVIIHQTGAAGKREIWDDPLLKPGDEYVLFLHEYETGKYFILGGPQGRFQIIEGEVFSMNNILSPGIVSLPPGLDVKGMDEASFLESVIASIGS
jgi:hypothetical protein